ncbi:MAG: glycine cleavage system aminomethyltransferase GcvT [Deltaproteobacteria bacterium]|nr:glycine cleavage system aminomethyltransferase GcvT [Deltaproteobacteria bacterium]
MTRRTPLYESHKNLGAKIVDFAGWEMPIQYKGVIDEHRAVRSHAGLFDVSHMGQIVITGPRALELVQKLTVNDPTKLTDNHAQYSILCNERGTVIDDIIVYRLHAEHFIIVVNASNRDKDVAWVKSHAFPGADVIDASDNYALIALQGPKAEMILSLTSDVRLSTLPSFGFCDAPVAGQPGCMVARTGYTGEPGCEIFCAPDQATTIWETLLKKGAAYGIAPIGLGARDTLRLEMAYSLYGHEITDEINPLEAGLSWVVKLDRDADFIGKSSLLKIRAQGFTRKLVGFELIDAGIPRQGYPIVADGKSVGFVTSGTMSPSLEKSIGLGFVPTELSTVGSRFSIDIRGRLREAVAVKTPFYQPQK